MTDGSETPGEKSRLPTDLLFEDTAHRRFVQYVLVGAVGLAINEGVLFLATGVVGLSYVIGGFLGRAISILANYAMNDVWTWGGRGGSGARQWSVRGAKYVLTRIVGIGIGLSALVVFVEVFAIHYLIANVLAVGVGVVWGFGVSERWVWADASTESMREWASRRTSQLSKAVRDGKSRLSDWGSRLKPSDEGSRLKKSYARARSFVESHREESEPRDYARRPYRRVRNRLAAVDRRSWVVVGFATILGLWFVWYTTQLYRAYVLTGADFGSYVHIFSTTVSGEGFLQQGKFRINHPSDVYWGAHSSLTLLLLLPVYALFPSPITLLVVKAAFVSASVVALWVLAREVTGHDWVAALAVVSYAFNPFLWSAWAFDFQEQMMLPLAVFATYYAYEKRRHLAFLGLLLFVLFTNEFMVPIVGGFVVGLAIAGYRADELDERWAVLLGAVGCVVLAHVVSGAIVDAFSRHGGLPSRNVAIPFQQYVDHPRTSMFAAAEAAIRHPVLALDSLFNALDAKLIAFFALFVPVALISLTDELTILAFLPFLGFAWVLGHKPAYYRFMAHYPFYFLPFVYVGLVHTLDRVDLPSVSREWVPRLLVYVLVLNLVTVMLVGAMNVRPIPETDDHTQVLDEAVESIPEDASLVTQNNIYPHVADRPNTKFMLAPYDVQRYQEVVGPITPEFVMYDTKHHGHWSNVVQGTFDARLGHEYGLYKYEDGVWIFQRGYDGPVTSITDDEEVSVFSGEREAYQAESFSVANGERTEEGIASTGDFGTVWFGPYEILPAGTYTAQFLVNATGDGTVGEVDVTVGQAHETIASKQVQGTGEWTTVELTFTIGNPTRNVELRGSLLDPNGRIELASATIRLDDRPVPDNVAPVGPENDSGGPLVPPWRDDDRTDGSANTTPSGEPRTPTMTPTPTSTRTPTRTDTPSNETRTPISIPTPPSTPTESPPDNETDTPTSGRTISTGERITAVQRFTSVQYSTSVEPIISVQSFTSVEPVTSVQSFTSVEPITSVQPVTPASGVISAPEVGSASGSPPLAHAMRTLAVTTREVSGA